MNWENADQKSFRYLREEMYNVRKQFFAGFLTPTRFAPDVKNDGVLRRFTLTLVLEGRGAYRDDSGCETELFPGLLLLRPPGTVFSITRVPVHKKYREFVMNLPTEFYSILLDTELAPRQTAMIKVALDNLLFARTIGLVESLDSIQNYRFAPWLIEVVRYLDYIKNLAESTQPKARKDLFEKACRLLESRLEEKFSLENAAQQLGISSRSLRTMFHANSGIGPNEYRLRCKFEYAGHLLLHSSLSVKEIAGRIGYAHAQGFCRQFRDILGCSPVEYRNKYEDSTN